MKDIVYVSGKGYEHLVNKCIELDETVYEPKYVGNREFYRNAFNKNPETFIFALDKTSGNLAGYILTTPLNETAYNKMRSGNYIDTEGIKKEDVLKINDINDNRFYIYSMVVSPNYQGLKVSKRIIEKLFSFFEDVNEEYGLESVLMDIVNPKVLGNISRFDVSPVAVTNHDSVMFEKQYGIQYKRKIAI